MPDAERPGWARCENCGGHGVVPERHDAFVREDALVPLIGVLRRMGLVFLAGAPPASEIGCMLVYTGGCDAMLAMWDAHGDLMELGFRRRIRPELVDCWMRLPNPVWWPVVKPDGALMPLQDVHSIETLEVQAWMDMVRAAEEQA